jgi:hypothetical protein
MIDPEFEIDILIEGESGDTPEPVNATLRFNEIDYYYASTYLGRDVTVMAMMNGEAIMANFKYETFKKKYNERKGEILASAAHRPEH